MSPKQSDAELEAHLREQVGFLAASCKSFDEGNREEYKRMTGPLRIILHDTEKQKSLLALLNNKSMLFVDTAHDLNAQNIAPHIGLALIKVVKGGPSSYEAPIDMPRPGISISNMVSFDQWWNKTVFAFRQYKISRRELVLTVAEKDGGVHVDLDLGKAYYALSRLNALGWTSHANGIDLFIPLDPDNPPPLPEGYVSFGEIIGPVPASIRQITHEVIRSIFSQYQQLLTGVY